MRTGFLAACISLMLVTTGGFAQRRDSAASASQEKERAKPVVITATVTAYHADQTLSLDANGTPHTYDLSQTEVTYKIDPNIRVGATVKVTDETDAMGHQTITVSVIPVKGRD
jgi:hypothetical protein